MLHTLPSLCLPLHSLEVCKQSLYLKQDKYSLNKLEGVEFTLFEFPQSKIDYKMSIQTMDPNQQTYKQHPERKILHLYYIIFEKS